MRIQLLKHNKIAYNKVLEAFEKSQRTCVVHPTGTGKSYLIAAVSEHFKNVLILGPNVFVLDQVHDVLKWRKKGVEYMTYQMLARMDTVPTGYDLVCLDEFHRAGAQEWGAAVDRLLNVNSDAKVFGTTATPIRYLNHERNMADELFDNNIASYISIGEAWSRSILPVPKFVIGLFNFRKAIEDAEERIKASKKLSIKEKRERLFRLSNARLEWNKSIGMPAILKKHLDPDIRRIIVFCSSIERLESMRKTVIGWFQTAGFNVNSACTVHIGQSDKKLREAMNEFESNEGEGVRLMFSVNMLNEGVHIPQVGAVLMLRTTNSRIIYMQQMGRCLTAANTEKPVILDMVDNITTTSSIHGLQTDFLDWQQIRNGAKVEYNRSFLVTDYRQSIRDVLEKLAPQELSFETWEDQLKQLQEYCKKYGHTPTRKNPEIFRKYMYLMANYRDTDEMKKIIQKYGQQIMWNKHNREFMEHELRVFIDTHHRGPSRWIAEDLRWYKMFIVIKKHEPEHPIILECRKLAEERLKAEQEIWYSEAISIINDFINENGRLPKSTALPDGTYEPIQKWRGLKKKYSDRDEVKAIMAKYGSGRKNTFTPLETRIKMCEDFCKEHGFLPHASFSDEKIVKIWRGLKRFHADNPRVKAIMEYPALNPFYIKIEQGIKKVEDFYAKYGRLPSNSKNVSEEEKKAKNSMVNIFEKYPDNPRVKVLMAKRVRAIVKRKSISRITALKKKIEDTAQTKRLSKVNNKERRKASLNKKMHFHLQRLTSFYETEGRFPLSGSKVSKAERNVYRSMTLLLNDFSKEPEVKNLLGKKPNVSIVLQEGIKLLLDFVDKAGRLPVDNSNPISGERRALATWRTLKKNYPDLPVTRKLMQLNPFGSDRLGLAIQKVIEFESKWQRLPRTNKGGVDDESKAYEKLAFLRKRHPDHPAVKALLEKYKDYEPRMEITREIIAKVREWIDEKGRLPKCSKKDKEERKMAYALKHLRNKHSDMPEVKALLSKFQDSINNDVEGIAC